MKTINTFRIVAFLEGLSFILLLFIAVPIKYLYEDPTYVKLLGMPHGLLFVAYVVLVVYLWSDFNLNNSKRWMILLASIVPFGTFYIEYRYLRTNHV